MIEYIRRRGSVNLEQLMVIAHREDWGKSEEEVYEDLMELVRKEEVILHRTNHGGIYYRTSDNQAEGYHADLDREAAKLLPLLSSHMEEVFTVNRVNKTLWGEFGFQSDTKTLLLRLVKEGKIRVKFTKGSPGGPSPHYEIVKAAPTERERMAAEGWFSVQHMAKVLEISRRRANELLEEWDVETEDGKYKVIIQG